MATHKLAILVSAVGAAKAAKDLKGVDAAVGGIGARAGQGLRTAGRNIAGLGAVAVAGIAVAVRSGLQDLATLESAVTSVDGAIKQVGLTGKVTGSQIAGWANDIERDIGAAFDDKDITRATTTLIRFGHVTESNLRPAMVVMTDLAAKTGSVESASSLLSKALADPAKAAGKLARQGIILTAAQQKQVKAALKVNDTGRAQKIILDAVAASTKGAAAASQGPYARSLKVLSDVSEDARKALATGFLPVIEKVADMLGTELAKPETLNNIKEFGTTLAGGLDDLVSIAKNLPWDAIGTSLKIGGAGAKTILGAFSSLPPWVQTAVATSWGLNKLTGGALGGIVGELSKGLIKGVLGMNAGVVNLKAGVVNGGGVPGGGAVPVGGKAAGLGGKILDAGSKLLIVGAVAELASEFGPVITQAGIDLHKALDVPPMKLPIPDEWPWGPKNTPTILPDLFGGNGLLGGSAAGAGGALTGNLGHSGPMPKANQELIGLQHDTVNSITGVKGATDSVKSSTDAVKAATDLGVAATNRTDTSVKTGSVMGANATTGGASRITSQSIGNTSRIVGAVAAARPIVSTSVKVFVTPAGVTTSTSTAERYGSTTGSSGSGSNGSNDTGHGK